MRRNKGYSLIELLVAVAILLVLMAEVGALMVNSQHLYRNGFYALNMQENAQQVIEQVQTLLMNANPWDKADRSEATRDSVITRTENTVDGIPSDIITIHTLVRELDSNGLATGNFKKVTYQIGRDCDLIAGVTSMQGTGDKKYATLYMSRQEGAAAAVYTPMAQGVKAIHLGITQDIVGGAVTAEVKTNYLNADLLTLSVDMQNQQYSYTASSEVYLRNQPGTGGPEVPAVSPSTGSDTDLNVLRVHVYDLDELLPAPESGKVWYYKFADDEAATLSTSYAFSGDRNHQLTCDGIKNSSSWSVCVNKGTVWAAQDVSGKNVGDVDFTDRKEITIHTDAVNVNTKLPIYGPNRSDPYISVFPVSGICVCDTCVKTRDMRAQIWLDVKQLGITGADIYVLKDHDGFSVKKNASGDVLNTDDVISGEFKNLTFATMQTSGTENYINLAGVRFKVAGYQHIAGKPTDASTNSALNQNYSYKGDMFVPTNSGNWAHKYTLTTVKEGTANAFALKCADQAPYGQSYWDNIVSNDGYVRVKMSFTFNRSCTGTYTCYGYVFPKEFGSDTQQTKLWDMMDPSDTTYDFEAEYMGATP